MKMASADDKRGDDGRTATKGGDDRCTTISIFLLLLVVSHVHVVNSACTTTAPCCYITSNLAKAQPTSDVQEVLPGNLTSSSKSGMCYVLYMLSDDQDAGSLWNLKKYHYMAASTWLFNIDCTKVLKPPPATATCSLTKFKAGSGEDRLDFVCCCKGNLCNDPIQNEAVNPRIQYTKKLNASGDAACFVDFKLRSPKKCKGKQTDSTSVCIYRLYQRVLYQQQTCEREHVQEADGDELSGVTIGVDRRTESEREEDNYQPRDLMNPAEKADELRRLGKQAAGTSVTINPNEGSDFGDHTEARGGVFDDDSEAAPTTNDKPIATTTTTDKANTNQGKADTTTNSKATNQTEPPTINKNTQKKKTKEKKNEKEKNA